MDIEILKSFSVDGTNVKLECITGVKSVDDEEKHFFVAFSDSDNHISIRFGNITDTDACFESFFKMKSFY